MKDNRKSTCRTAAPVRLVLPLVVLAQALTVAVAGCSRPDQDSKVIEPPSVSQPSPASRVFPSLKEFLTDSPSIAMHSSTRLVVTRGSSIITITDEKELRLIKAARDDGSPDFFLSVKRGHTGSESGDTQETFTAIRIDRDYWTRGTGGPFVWWDDALHEPDEALVVGTGETRALLDLAGVCLDSSGDAGAWEFRLSGTECDASTGPTDARMTVAFRTIEGRSTWSGSNPGTIILKMDFMVQSQGHVAQVALQHEAIVRDLAPDESVKPPDGAISSRRPRPVKMAEKVLKGLVDEWGPGAPNVLRDK